MSHNQPKKLVKPSNVTSLSTFVFGLVTLIVCASFGIVSKNVSISLNCCAVKVSIQSFNSFAVQSAAAQLSSRENTTSIQDEIISKDLSIFEIVFSSLKSKTTVSFSYARYLIEKNNGSRK